MEIRKFIETNKVYIGAFLFMGVATLVSGYFTEKQPEEGKPAQIDSVDTLIPRGHILIPLELENLEHISSLIGSSGVVDLYTGGTENKKRRLIASRIKIIQAPFNHQVYAALIRESEGAAIQSYIGSFRAVVQNPKQAGSRVEQTAVRNISITYQR